MKILIFVAHPDDIEPQMGGTIAKYTNMGYEVVIYQLLSPHHNGEKNLREKEAITSATILGASITFMDYDYNNLHNERELVEKIDEIILAEKPNRIFTCWNGDTHQDHRIVSNAVMTASRKNTFDLILFEPIIPCGLTDKNFHPNMFVDISNHIKKKIESINAYNSQK